MAQKQGEVAFLPEKTITAALTGWVSDVYRINSAFPRYASFLATFTYGSGGTTAKAWVQTSIDGGATWIDVACFAFLLASAKKVSSVHVNTVPTPGTTPTDGALADNTILNGVLGGLWRVKVTTTGTYAGGTKLSILGVVR